MSGSDDIFGSGSDSDDGTAAVAQPVVSQEAGSLAAAAGEEAPPAAPAAPMATLLLPKQLPRNSREKVYTSVLPNIIGINTECFDERTFMDQYEEDEGGHDAAKSVMRWKYRADGAGQLARDEGGNPIMESNARMVRWSDGSLQLMVGQEVFDVEQTVHKDGVMNQYLYEQQTDQGGDTALQCASKLHGRLAFKPSSLTSAAHRELATRIRSKHMRTKKVREIHTTADPEAAKDQREQKEQKKIHTREKKRRRESDGGGGGGGGTGRRMNRSFLEEGQDDDEEALERGEEDDDDEDEADGDISALKGKKPGSRRAPAGKAPGGRGGKLSLSSHMSSRGAGGGAAEDEDMERAESSEGSAAGGAADGSDSSSSEDEAVVAVKKRSKAASAFDDSDSDSE
jgi:RNA polymerase-associated protein LEO1